MREIFVDDLRFCVKDPDKTVYKPGEAISYSGIAVIHDGMPVEISEYSIAPGTLWRAEDKRLDALVAVRVEKTEHWLAIPLRRKNNIHIPLLCILLVLAIGAGAGAAWWLFGQPAQGDTGSRVIPKGNMSDEEAQALVDEMAEKSRITVSIAPKMLLRDNGTLRVNLIVPEQNNGLSERLEVMQDGKTVYRSGVVEPGNRLEWGQSSEAHAGNATATVYAVADGVDSGSPVSVEVEIVQDKDSE